MLSRLSVKKPMTVFVCVMLVLILGVMSFINMTTDLLPNMDLPYAIAYTTYIGASPEQVEQSVTKTLESALATTSGVKNITSISQENVSIVVLEFEEGTGMDSAMIEMNASLDQIAGSLPEAAGSPVLMKINPDMLPIMVLAVDSDNMARNELSEFTSSTVIPALERVDGVASVSGSGLVESQIRVELDQAKIDELNDKVLAAIDGSLADAEKQLKDSRRQINDAKKKLEEQSGTAYAQLVAAAQQLADAKDQASLGSTLTSAEVKAIQAVLAQYDNMVNLRDSYNASEDYARTHLSAVKYAELQSLQLTRTQLRANLKAAENSLKAADATLKEIGSSEAALQQDVTNAKDAQEAAQTAYDEALAGAPERLKDDPGWQDLLRQEQEKQAEVDDLQAQLEKDPDNTGLQAQLNTAEAELAAIQAEQTAYLTRNDPQTVAAAEKLSAAEEESIHSWLVTKYNMLDGYVTRANSVVSTYNATGDIGPCDTLANDMFVIRAEFGRQRFSTKSKWYRQYANLWGCYTNLCQWVGHYGDDDVALNNFNTNVAAIAL